MSFKLLNDLNTAKLLTDMHVLSDWHFIKQYATFTMPIMHCLQNMLECTKHIAIDYFPKTSSAENGL
jgi:hypothetical protein